MNRIKFTIRRLFVVALMIFTLAALTLTIPAQAAAAFKKNFNLVSESPDSTKFTFVSLAVVNVTNVEKLYAAVNNSSNAGNQIVIAPGVYMLSVTDPNGAARPNSGRLELQENMSLRGVFGDRGAVI